MLARRLDIGAEAAGDEVSLTIKPSGVVLRSTRYDIRVVHIPWVELMKTGPDHVNSMMREISRIKADADEYEANLR